MIKRSLLFMAIVIATLMVLSASALAADADTGVIAGMVINGTAEGSTTADHDVTLKTYSGTTEVASVMTKTDEQGGFRFDGLSREPDYTYQVSARHQDVEYDSDQLTFAEDETTKPVGITVYDTTTSDETVKIAVAHTIIYLEGSDLRVAEYVLLANMGDKTYVGSSEVIYNGANETLKFSLPEGATDLEYQRGLSASSATRTEEGIVDTTPVVPGATEVAFSYRMDNSSDAFTFSKMLYYTTISYSLLIQGKDARIVSDQLSEQEPMTINDAQFACWSGADLAPGTELAAYVSGLSIAGGRGFPKGPVLLAVGFTHVVVFGYLFIRKRRQAAGVRVIVSEDELEQRKERLLLEIAKLDDEFEGAKISPKEYRARRREKKMELIDLMQRPKGE